MKKTKGKRSAPANAGGSLQAGWMAWWRSKAPVIFFAARFAALVALLYAILALPVADNALDVYLRANAWFANAILDLLGQGTHVSGVTIASPSFAVAIRRGCDAVEPTWLLCAAILAFPGAWRRKVPGMLGGIVALQLLNIVRIVTLYWIGSRFPDAFNSAHVEIWPAIFIIAAIGLFMGWIGWAYAK